MKKNTRAFCSLPQVFCVSLCGSLLRSSHCYPNRREWDARAGTGQWDYKSSCVARREFGSRRRFRTCDWRCSVIEGVRLITIYSTNIRWAVGRL
ncbi:hypothetical protein ACLOJK_013197 [Asimina triloba]